MKVYGKKVWYFAPFSVLKHHDYFYTRKKAFSFFIFLKTTSHCTGKDFQQIQTGNKHNL
jgi:hypothetical protein